jgi:anhydro-N-acetylmuramic acid kinase
LLEKLNALDYYKKPWPKSLANDFGTDVIYPMIKATGCSIPDALRTFCEHIISQINGSVLNLIANSGLPTHNSRLLATGGGAFNQFLIERLKEKLGELKIDLHVPEKKLVSYKEALIMAFIGVLRWRQEYTVLASVTGAARNSIGGALWTGQEA